MSTQSTLELQRGSAYTDRVRAYKVLVDGQEVGTIKNKSTESFTIAPGRHDVTLKVDWASSSPVTIDAPPGGTVRLQCGPRATPFTAIWYTIFARKKYLKLEPVS